MLPAYGDHVDEVPLLGGSVAESVVRVGDTVRRPIERWSTAVHALLRHLELVGFDGAPRFLGIDERGREVLSFIEGVPSTRPWPEALRTDDGLHKLGELLRRFHDAVAAFAPTAEAEWWTGTRPVGDGEIVTHGDLGPWNILWRNDEPVAFIDWDFAEPESPLLDFAELAFFTTPMRDDSHCLECGFEEPPDRRRRLTVLCDAYGVDDHAAVLDEMERYWITDIERTARLGPLGIKPWDGFHRRGIHLSGQVLLTWLREHRHLVE